MTPGQILAMKRWMDAHPNTLQLPYDFYMRLAETHSVRNAKQELVEISSLAGLRALFAQ